MEICDEDNIRRHLRRLTVENSFLRNLIKRNSCWRWVYAYTEQPQVTCLLLQAAEFLHTRSVAVTLHAHNYMTSRVRVMQIFS